MLRKALKWKLFILNKIFFSVFLLSYLYTGINGEEDELSDDLILIQPQETFTKKTECKSDCLLLNTCGSWLEHTSAKSGTYNLDQQLDLNCQFLSAPNTVEVAWKYKTPVENIWKNVSCNARTEFECNATKLGEHRTTSFCTSEKLDLSMNGVYRCETTDVKETVYSSEIRVDVVGIQSAVKTSEHLHFGKSGYIEVMICSNPTAHIYWVLNDLALQPGQSENGLAVSNSFPASTESALEIGPIHHIPYCYLNRLIIAKVDKRIKNVRLILSIDDNMLDVDLKLRLRHISSNSSQSPFLYTNIRLILLLITLYLFANKKLC